MRTIYLDSDYICHADYSDGRRAIQTDTLDGFGDVALESVRYIPENETYTREDGRVFYGEFSQILYDTEKEQRQYDIDMEILNIITEGVGTDDESTGNSVPQED